MRVTIPFVCPQCGYEEDRTVDACDVRFQQCGALEAYHNPSCPGGHGERFCDGVFVPRNLVYNEQSPLGASFGDKTTTKLDWARDLTRPELSIGYGAQYSEEFEQ